MKISILILEVPDKDFIIKLKSNILLEMSEINRLRVGKSEVGLGKYMLIVLTSDTEEIGVIDFALKY